MCIFVNCEDFLYFLNHYICQKLRLCWSGTHVRASVPPKIQRRFCGLKNGTTQNVLAAISFDLKFTYVLAGWEGSAHDLRVLNDTFARPGSFSFPEGIIGLLHLLGLLVLINFVRCTKA